MSAPRQQRVAIIGAGITGLAVARQLSRQAPQTQVILLDSDTRLGGKISTIRQDGFVIEGGPDSFLSYKPRGLGLCRELGLESRLHGTSGKVRRTYVMRNRRLYQLPEGLTGLIPSRFGPMLETPLISPLGKLRMGLDYFIPPRRDQRDESLAGFVSRRLGREAYERMIEPLMSGIYAGDGNQLSLDATFPNLRKAEIEHGNLIKSMLAAKAEAKHSTPAAGASRWPAFLTLQGGLAEIVEAAAQQLGGTDIRLNTRVTRIAGGMPDGGYRLDIDRQPSLYADAVIVTAPAFAAADLLDDLDAEAAAALRGIPYVSTATVSVAYPLEQVPAALDAHGYIVPRSEGRPVLACTWTSTKFPHRAPQGQALIRAFIGRAGEEDVLAMSDSELVGLVRDELRMVLRITAAPTLQFVFRWPQSMPQYTIGHLERVRTLERRFAAHPGLFLAGAAYRGIGIPDCIASGETAAANAIAHLHHYPAAEEIAV